MWFFVVLIVVAALYIFKNEEGDMVLTRETLLCLFKEKEFMWQ